MVKKSGANLTEESKAKRIAALRSRSPDATTMPMRALTNPDRHLTEKQKLFVQCWAQGETILSASERAGYSDGGTYAYRLAKDPAILKLYNAEKAKYEEAAQMTRKKVMDGLMDAVEMARVQADPQAMIAGWREIGRMCGYFEPVKKQIDINVSGNVVTQHFARMSDAQLFEIISKSPEILEESATATLVAGGMESDEDGDADQ